MVAFLGSVLLTGFCLAFSSYQNDIAMSRSEAAQNEMYAKQLADSERIARETEERMLLANKDSEKKYRMESMYTRFGMTRGGRRG